MNNHEEASARGDRLVVQSSDEFIHTVSGPKLLLSSVLCSKMSVDCGSFFFAWLPSLHCSYHALIIAGPVELALRWVSKFHNNLGDSTFVEFMHVWTNNQ